MTARYLALYASCFMYPVNCLFELCRSSRCWYRRKTYDVWCSYLIRMLSITIYWPVVFTGFGRLPLSITIWQKLFPKDLSESIKGQEPNSQDNVHFSIELLWIVSIITSLQNQATTWLYRIMELYQYSLETLTISIFMHYISFRLNIIV